MQISVVIPCLNAAGTLPAQLEALARQTVAPWEVIVADNGSSDGSGAIAARYRDSLPRFRIVDATARRGAAHARNVGATAARGDVVAFCDADDLVDADWVRGIRQALAEYDFVASRFDVRALNAPAMRHSHSQETRLQNRYGFLPHAGGSGLAIRLHVHRKVGGFDETMRYLEDTDYCWKVQLAGVPLGFADGALVYVRRRRTAPEAFRQARRWATSEVQLYKRYRALGFAVDNRSGLRQWRRLPRLLVDTLRGRRSVLEFARLAGIRAGRLVGILSYFTVML